MTDERICIDCKGDNSVKTIRPTPHGGPRSPLCTTHYRARRKTRKERNHELMVKRNYNMPEGGYDKLLEFQDGTCAICRVARGIKKYLCLDHEHGCCLEPPTCGLCTRGLLCNPCNELLGRAKDDPGFFYRAAQYLSDPPAQKMRRLGLIDPATE